MKTLFLGLLTASALSLSFVTSDAQAKPRGETLEQVRAEREGALSELAPAAGENAEKVKQFKQEQKAERGALKEEFKGKREALKTEQKGERDVLKNEMKADRQAKQTERQERKAALDAKKAEAKAKREEIKALKAENKADKEAKKASDIAPAAGAAQ